MATDSRTWFYTTPEARPYYIEERVNHTLWKHRLANIHMICTQAASRIRMEGRWHNEMPITFAYQDSDGMFVVEWHVDHGDARWKEIQGKPQYQGLRRLTRAR